MAPRQRRLTMPSEQAEHHAWERWQHIALDPKATDDLQGMVTLAEETDIPLAVVWHLVKQWVDPGQPRTAPPAEEWASPDRKSTRLNSSNVRISYAVFCLKKKNKE